MKGGRVKLNGRASECGVAGARGALDGGGVQAVQIEPVADHLQHAQLLLRQLAVGHGHVARERIGGLVEPRRQRPLSPTRTANKSSVIAPKIICRFHMNLRPSPIR